MMGAAGLVAVVPLVAHRFFYVAFRVLGRFPRAEAE
jgi:hypothetical protein